MSRLIKKSMLPNINLNNDYIELEADILLNEDFIYKFNQAYDLINIILEINKSIKKKDNIKIFNNYLTELSNLDNNVFNQIQYAIDNLSTYIKYTEYNIDLELQYQELVNEYKKTKDKDLLTSLTDISTKMIDADVKLELDNSIAYFKQFFQYINSDTLNKLYNKENKYYSINNIIPETLNLVDFINFCENNVTKTSGEIRMSRKYYIENYLLKSILGDNYNGYIEAVTNYLHSSSNDNLQTIANITLSYPDLLELNKIVAGNINTLYRGLSFHSVDDEDYIDILNGNIYMDEPFRYVSTSRSKEIARKFASNYNVGIIFEIQPGTIIFSSYLLDGVYGESEVIIDMKDSTIINIITV